MEEALRQGMETWAAVRPSSSGNTGKTSASISSTSIFSKEELISQLDGQEFDYVVHAAGATKCLQCRRFLSDDTRGYRKIWVE